MDLYAELNKIRENKDLTEEQQKEESLKLIRGLDFSDPEIRQSGKNFVKIILNKAEQNNYSATIEDFWVRTINEVFVRTLAIDMGVEGIKTNYIAKTPEGEDFDAFHTSGEHSITFFEDNKLFTIFKNRHGPDRFTKLGLAVKIAAHELEHEVQEIKMQELAKSPFVMTPDDFLMSQHFIGKRLSYFSKKYLVESSEEDAKALTPIQKTNEKIYNKNHDDFLFEIDANLVGYEKSEKLMKEISPYYFHEAIDFAEDEFKKLTEKLIDNATQIKFKHKSNANNTYNKTDKKSEEKFAIRATHKSALIVDSTLPICNEGYRNYFFNQYPSLSITHHKDGTKKMLDEINSDFDRETDKITKGDLSEKDKQYHTARLKELRRTVIDNDPILLLEDSLKKVIDIKITDPNDKEQVKKALSTFNRETERIKGLVSYIEEADYDTMIKLIYDAKVAVKNSPIRINSNVTQGIYEQRSQYFNKLHLDLIVNKDVRKVRQQRADEANAERKKYIDATDVLKAAFPGFKPNPSTYALQENVEIFNKQERYIVEESISKYLEDLKKYGKTDKKSVAETEKKLKEALDIVYPFDIAPGIRRGYEMKLDIEEISPLDNVYTHLERNLQKLASYQFDGKNYYFYDEPEKLYSPAEFNKIHEKIMLETKETLASMDESDYAPVSRFINSAKRTAQKQPIKNNNTRAYQEKLKDLREIDLTIGVNAEFKKAIQKQVDARIERENAVKLLQSVFPDYNPLPYSEDSQKLITPEYFEEKFILEKSITQYIKDLKKNGAIEIKTENQITQELTNALKTIYKFNIPDLEQIRLQDKYDFKEILPLDNIHAKYSNEKLEENMFSNMSLNECLELFTNYKVEMVDEEGNFFFEQNPDKIYNDHEFNIIKKQLLNRTKKIISDMKEEDYLDLRKQLDSIRATVNSKATNTAAQKKERIQKISFLNEIEQTIKANKAFDRFTQKSPIIDSGLTLDECLEALTSYTHDENGYHLPGNPYDNFDQKTFNQKMSQIMIRAKKLLGEMKEDDYKEVERKINQAKKSIQKLPKKTPEQRNMHSKKLDLMRDIDLAVDANREFRRAQHRLVKKRLDSKKAKDLITLIFPNFNPQALVQTGGGSIGNLELTDNFNEKLLLEKSFIQYKIDREKHPELKKLSPEISDKEFLQALDSYYTFEVSPEQRAIFEDKYNRTIYPIRNVCSVAPESEQSPKQIQPQTRTPQKDEEKEHSSDKETMQEDESELE